MPDQEIPPAKTFQKTVIINAPPSKVWDALTVPELMKKWMTEADIDIITNWKVGGPVIMQVELYKKPSESKGIVLQFIPNQNLKYTHLSSLSRLPDKTENYTVIDFKLTPQGNQTALSITLSNFPTETIYKHLAFYWNVALELLKRFVEQ